MFSLHCSAVLNNFESVWYLFIFGVLGRLLALVGAEAPLMLLDAVLNPEGTTDHRQQDRMDSRKDVLAIRGDHDTRTN